jgi:hypothetical protein
MKQKYLFFALILLSISSCTSVKFETSQPKDAPELSAFPPEITGNYISKNKDTVLILSNSFQLKESTIFGKGKLNLLMPNEMVLKRMNEYYILSLKDSNAWEVLAFKQKGTNLIVYYINIDQKKEDKIITTLKGLTKVTEILDGTGKIDRYQINPTKEEFQLLFDNKIFSEIVKLKKIK